MINSYEVNEGDIIMSISLKETLKQVEEYKRFVKEPRESYMYNNIITLLEELQIRRAFDAKEKRD